MTAAKDTAAFACNDRLQAMVAYLFGCELKDRQTGLVAAALMAIVPGQSHLEPVRNRGERSHCPSGIMYQDLQLHREQSSPPAHSVLRLEQTRGEVASVYANDSILQGPVAGHVAARVIYPACLSRLHGMAAFAGYISR